MHPTVSVPVVASPGAIHRDSVKRGDTIGRLLAPKQESASAGQEPPGWRPIVGRSRVARSSGNVAAGALAPMRLDAYFWARVLLFGGIIAGFVSALTARPIRGYVLIFAGLGISASGVIIFSDIGGGGTAWAQANLRRSRNRGWPRNSVRNLYRWTGSLVFALGLVAIAIGIVVARGAA